MCISSSLIPALGGAIVGSIVTGVAILGIEWWKEHRRCKMDLICSLAEQLNFSDVDGDARNNQITGDRYFETFPSIRTNYMRYRSTLICGMKAKELEECWINDYCRKTDEVERLAIESASDLQSRVSKMLTLLDAPKHLST